MADEELEKFNKSFSDVLEEMAREINPRESKRIQRKGLGKLIDVAILLRSGFSQAWQFIVIFQALFIFLGLSPQVSAALRQLGISISGTMIGIIALAGIIFFFLFGLALLLLGGTQRSSALISGKQAPATRMSYTYYKAMNKWTENMENRLDRIEAKLDKLETRE